MLQTFGAWRWRVFAATWLCYAGFYFARKPFYIVKADLGERLQLSAATLGTIGAVYLIAYTIGQFLAGALGQRLGSRRLLIGGMAAAVAASVGFGLAGGAVTLAVLMAINGIAQATGWSGTVGNLAQWFRRSERGRVMGVWATCYQVGGVASNAMAAWILVRFGDQMAFFAGALVLLGVLGFFAANQANRPRDKGFADLPPDVEADGAPADAEAEGAPAADGAAAATSADPGWSRGVWTSVLLVGGFYFFVKFIRYALWSWAPFLLKREFGLQGDEAGYIATLFDLAGIAGVLAAGWASDRFFAGRRVGVSLLLLGGMLAATLLLATVGRGSLTMFGVAMGLIGFCLYGPDALMTGAGAMDIGGRRGAILAAGIINGMGSAGSIVQELWVGQVLDAKAADSTATFLALLVGASLGALALLGAVEVRNRRGLSDA